MDGDNLIIKNFLFFHFQNRKFQYNRIELEQCDKLVKLGVLLPIENSAEVFEINSNSIDLQKTTLLIAETKLNKKLPLDISEAFKFIEQFDKLLKEEYKTNVSNAFDTIIKGLKLYVLTILSKKGLNVKEFFLSLNDENKKQNHLFLFERSFFEFLPLSKYSEQETFEIFNKLWQDEKERHYVTTCLRELPKRNFKMSKKLLKYAYGNDIPVHFIYELLISLYNAGDITILKKIITLKEDDIIASLGILGRLKYHNENDAENAFKQINNLDFSNKDIARQQSYLISNIIENKYTPNTIREDAFKLYVDFLENATDEIKEIVYQDINFINGHEARKYNLLHLYLIKTENLKVIKTFFNSFEDSKFIFHIMKDFFTVNPDFRFSMYLFEDGIRHVWNRNQEETEKHILNLFSQHPSYGLLGVKVILSAYLGVFKVDLLKLDKAEYQLNAIKWICKQPAFFDKLLPLILTLRNSTHEEVRIHLQDELSKKVFHSYNEIIFNQIKENIGTNKKDKEFLKPIQKALYHYNQLKEQKESINDLNPQENERDLMDLYYRLEHEENAKMMNRVQQGKGTFMEMVKNVIIVRGNSIKYDEKEPSPLTTIKTSMLVDSDSYKNPDLFEHNLNTLK